MLGRVLKKPAAKAMYPNILFLMQATVTLPVSTATMERNFSYMKQIKTRLRSRLLPESIDHLMRIAIEGPNKLRDIDFDAVTNIWYRQKPNRRVQWITGETLNNLDAGN